MSEMHTEDVLTLAETAAYLRVPEEEVLRLAEQRELPAQRIAGEWRFLKRALGHWLIFGSRIFREYPPWFIDHPMLEELLLSIEKRLLKRIEPERPIPGSKEAVRKHVGVLKGEDDLDEVLASLSAVRARSGGSKG